MADDLKRNGGLIPKVRPGQDTANYLDDILSKITLPGAIFLSIFAVLPALVHGTFVQTGRILPFFRRNFIVDYGRCNLRYSSADQYVFVEPSL